jgi:hypothetical protein
MLGPNQKRLPNPLTEILERTLQVWNAGDEDITRNHLTKAMELAQKLRHF